MRRCLILIMSLILLAVILPLQGQNTVGNERAVISYLDQLAEKYQVRFSYNVKLLRNLQFNKAGGLKTLEAELEYLSKALPIQFNLANAGNYAISPVRKPLTFKVNDGQDNAPIDLVYVTVNKEKQFYLLPEQGNYTLANSFPTDSLHIRTSFYSPVATTAAAVAANNHQVYLSQDTVNLGEITVHSYLTSGVNSYLGDHRVEVNMKDLALIAGETDGDVFQVLQAIPGIRSPNGKPGSLNFRGSPFSQNLTLFDNIPIYHTGHFFGTFSPYNPSVIDRISVHRGTLPSRYGGRVGGLIEVETSDQVPDSTKTEITLNTVTAGIEIETPIGSRLGLHISGRTNYSGWLSPKLEAYRDLNFQGSRLSEFQLTQLPGDIELNRFGVRFSDMNARLVYDLNEKHKLSASLVYVDNQLDYGLDVNRREDEAHLTEMDNTGLNLGWRALWSETFNTEINFTNSSFRLFENRENGQDLNANGPERSIVENLIDDTRFSALFNLELNSKTKLNFGYEYKYQDVQFSRSQRNNAMVALDENRSGKGAINAVHGAIEQQFAGKLVINAGLRAIDFELTNQQFLDPRLSLTFLASKNLFLKASAGRAHQYLRQSFGNDFDDFRINNQFWVLIDRDEKVIEGTQIMLGALYEKSDWLFDLEIYQNRIANIFQDGDLAPGRQNGDLLGDLKTIGLDFLAKKRWPSFETWLSYTLGNTQERFERAPYRAAYYDQRNVLNVKWLYPKDRWSLALSWNMMSGLPVREPDEDDINENPLGPDRLPDQFEGRFPIQHQMDLSATYQFSRPGAGWRGVIGFSVLNLYNRNNVINIFQENVFVQDFQRFGVGIAPNIQLKLTF